MSSARTPLAALLPVGVAAVYLGAVGGLYAARNLRGFTLHTLQTPSGTVLSAVVACRVPRLPRVFRGVATTAPLDAPAAASATAAAAAAAPAAAAAAPAAAAPLALAAPAVTAINTAQPPGANPRVAILNGQDPQGKALPESLYS
jgi:hypothetical protein